MVRVPDTLTRVMVAARLTQMGADLLRSLEAEEEAEEEAAVEVAEEPSNGATVEVPNRPIRPLDVLCPEGGCEAVVGDPCRDTRPGRDREMRGYHPSRTEAYYEARA